MKVSHFMTAYVPICRDTSSIAEVEKLLTGGEPGPISVVDRDGRLVGILRSSDVLEAIHRFSRVADHILAREAICRNTSASCQAGEDIDVALSRMKSSRLSRLPVVDESGTLVGALAIVDPRLEEGGGFLEGASENPGSVPEPTVVGHRSPSYVDGSSSRSK